jgi:uncharacterized protein DUF3592
MDAANSVAIFAEENQQRYFRYLFLLQFIAAIPFLWFAHATGKVHSQLLLHGRTTAGTVIALVPVHFRSSSGSSSTAYEPVVTFHAGAPSGDDEYRFQEWKATRITPSVGAAVPVLFDPNDPDTAMVDRGYMNYLPWAPCAFIGLFLVVVATKGLFVLLFRRQAAS